MSIAAYWMWKKNEKNWVQSIRGDNQRKWGQPDYGTTLQWKMIYACHIAGCHFSILTKKQRWKHTLRPRHSHRLLPARPPPWAFINKAQRGKTKLCILRLQNFWVLLCFDHTDSESIVMVAPYNNIQIVLRAMHWYETRGQRLVAQLRNCGNLLLFLFFLLFNLRSWEEFRIPFREGKHEMIYFVIHRFRCFQQTWQTQESFGRAQVPQRSLDLG